MESQFLVIKLWKKQEATCPAPKIKIYLCNSKVFDDLQLNQLISKSSFSMKNTYFYMWMCTVVCLRTRHQKVLKTENMNVRLTNRTYVAARCDLCCFVTHYFSESHRKCGPDLVSSIKAIVYLLCCCAAVQTYEACTNRSAIMRQMFCDQN